MPDAATPKRDVDLFVAVAIGGVIGASARWGLSEAIATPEINGHRDIHHQPDRCVHPRPRH